MRSDTAVSALKIVDIYRTTLANTLDNPEEFIPSLTRCIREVIPILGVVIVAEPDGSVGSFHNQIETVENVRTSSPGSNELVSKTHTGWIARVADGKDILDDIIVRGQEHLRRAVTDLIPDLVAIHEKWSRIEHTPRIAVGIFRAERTDPTDGKFTDEDLEILEELEPHIAICVRLHVDMVRSRRGGFDFFAERCHALATQFSLTLAEFRVLRKMIEGASNNEIGIDLGTTATTVKTHITHILQKTGCRNRADLIGRYFSSKQTLKV